MNPLSLRLLFGIEVEHGFHEDPRDIAVQVLPLQAHTLLASGCLLRPLRNGLSVYGTAAAAEALHARLAADDSASPLHFKLVFDDRALRQYTAGLIDPAVGLPCFSSAFAAPAGPDGRRRLHRGEVVIEADGTAFAAPPLDALLTARDRLHPPDAIVSLDAADLLALLAHTGAAPPRFYLRLAPRATFWKYLFVGDWDDELRVVDADGVTAFDPPQAEPRHAGRPVVSVCSSTTVALRHQPDARFQLCQGRGPSPQVLMPRLPLATAGHLCLEPSGAGGRLMSPIFVNR